MSRFTQRELGALTTLLGGRLTEGLNEKGLAYVLVIAEPETGYHSIVSNGTHPLVITTLENALHAAQKKRGN